MRQREREKKLTDIRHDDDERDIRRRVAPQLFQKLAKGSADEWNRTRVREKQKFCGGRRYPLGQLGYDRSVFTIPLITGCTERSFVK